MEKFVGMLKEAPLKDEKRYELYSHDKWENRVKSYGRFENRMDAEKKGLKMHKDVTAFYNSRKAKDFYRHPSYDPDRHH
jgi:hypothetical protein